jgi:tRNA nucleotidyltransferase/poly(A) polymerase
MENWGQIAKEFFPKEFETFKRKLVGGRRPDSVIFSDITTDAKRRDLTINALYYDIDTREIIDLVGGVDDIKNGVVRTVGAAEDRFKEDRLRIMRSIRFAGRFGGELDSGIDLALQKDAALEGISSERIRDEFLKGISSAKSTIAYLKMVDKYNLFDWILNGLNINKDFIENKDPMIILAHMLKNNDLNNLNKTLNKLTYSLDENKGVRFLIALTKLSTDTAVTLKKAEKNSGVSKEQMKEFGKLEGIDSKLLNAFIDFEFSVSGPEAMEKTGLRPSAELGKAIQKMETDNFKKLL